MEKQSIASLPRPVLKWAGGKRQLLPDITPFLRDDFNTYIEPFVGGGAVFFYLLPDEAVLIDKNPDLINVYAVIRDDVDGLIASLKKHKNDKEYYYMMRNVDRDPEEFATWSLVERASRTIYMNRVCFNGLYRVNKRGEFNVPFGRYKRPTICDGENLRAVSNALQHVKIVHGSFEKCLEFAGEGDLVYLDPPYVPLSTTANFTTYTRDAFGFEEQEALHVVFKELDKRGCAVLESNSHCEYVLELYKDYHVNVLLANRAINCDGSGRGKIKEVLITNRPPAKG